MPSIPKLGVFQLSKSRARLSLTTFLSVNTVIAISPNIVQTKNIKLLFPNRMSVVKVEESSSPRILLEILNRKMQSDHLAQRTTIGVFSRTDNFVVQVYVNRPFLIDGYKFDLRVYVAVTSCDPFRVFVYKDGLARFTTQHYEEPSNVNCVISFVHFLLLILSRMRLYLERYLHAFNQLCHSKAFGRFHSR